MDIIFATTNQHKLQEIKQIIPNHNIISLKDLADNDDVMEDGYTFNENAYIKAKYFYDKYHKAVFADDSGLVVPALNGEPGVYSARYAGIEADYHKNNLKLLKNLEGISHREAYFITVICFIDEDGNVYYFEGRVNGLITDEIRGHHGFGYDPLFYIPEYGKTFGELDSTIKNQISHRSKAIRKFEQFLKEHYHE